LNIGFEFSDFLRFSKIKILSYFPALLAEIPQLTPGRFMIEPTQSSADATSLEEVKVS
jgi:hypothetical protein